ncbi:hypothetical protein AVEN_18009-1 [Araneus ventricosus]|uniref:Uncharacterized protein n=1 Tax=Araneus ventricosus TaxID=182803 RepID=A0A4Y2X4Y8_ARAVE|nr:hypothetical protein AVEN_18009-1 [Araneus ventricosus]
MRILFPISTAKELFILFNFGLLQSSATATYQLLPVVTKAFGSGDARYFYTYSMILCLQLLQIAMKRWSGRFPAEIDDGRHYTFYYKLERSLSR